MCFLLQWKPLFRRFGATGRRMATALLAGVGEPRKVENGTKYCLHHVQEVSDLKELTRSEATSFCKFRRVTALKMQEHPWNCRASPITTPQPAKETSSRYAGVLS